MRVLNKAFSILGVSTLMVSLYGAESAWLPKEGSYILTLSYTQESYDEFWLGDVDMDTSSDSEQVTYGLSAEYGLNEKIAFDAYIAHSKNEFGHPMGFSLEESDIADFEIGVRYQFVDETEHEGAVPTVAARLGIIIAGPYDAYPDIEAPDSAAAIGDGGNGFELQLLVGKYYQEQGLGYTFDLGYRNRNNDIPDDYYYGFGLFYSYEGTVTVGLDYRVNDSQGDLDISSPTFAGRFPELEEDVTELLFSVSYNFPEIYSLGLVYGDTLDGLNTPQNDILSLWVSAEF